MTPDLTTTSNWRRNIQDFRHISIHDLHFEVKFIITHYNDNHFKVLFKEDLGEWVEYDDLTKIKTKFIESIEIYPHFILYQKL